MLLQSLLAGLLTPLLDLGHHLPPLGLYGLQSGSAGLLCGLCVDVGVDVLPARLLLGPP